MRLLVSPINSREAVEALAGGADIIDVKNPREGSLGASFPWMIRSVCRVVDGRVPVSATIGDFEFKPGTASLAALGAAVSGAHYIKVGLFGTKTAEEALELLDGVCKTIREHDAEKQVVAAGYADFSRTGSVDPMELPEVGAAADADVVMVDTGIKDGRSSFEFMGEEGLAAFVDAAHDHGLECALAGTIKFEDVEALRRIKPDIVGVRGVVCGGDRTSTIRRELVEQFKRAVVG
ncbi:(5-formylfuran-3-yl)methyl phosphate synthase [Methermicoccus shengliensis]|uniref:(5-formylfuran-3-yl)methyl phosphate synthase n=1 Tax=Methermicoccus shengliensis TaxID=660064 RepID=A0A832RZ17_9EURY|nr:(5-formylfuran-3-yl)methyl phosphate synthase [Methermicoccus shengliensis]KUK04111.1 MAG: hypothetical protein XD46_1148 [Euryarchaeota archaeon 55_53]KUK29955.1 MAG: hypothetical protein XD62_0958 [Methanosarcinales archeaon 56_1174]MDI3487991.1 (5-formylfuran-3-yl)methyl phosphate synthase [Methanosarcinales archaeon]MDN5295587.1 (5-formylfuran-3-yl)methyl phosphate synthase [Methanosarcinales archaeon]HIH70379.1 (5-formylfuran-3-yl)methyl phosphate synthase [Methermicoccus shengliensis]